MIPASFRSIQIGSGADGAIWLGDHSKRYTINSAYNLFRSKNPVILPRNSFILWMLFRGRLKTREFLSSRGMQIAEDCGLRNQQRESINHIFFRCDVTKQSWKKCLEKLGVFEEQVEDTEMQGEFKFC